MGLASGRPPPAGPEIAGLREENLVDMAVLLAARRGDPVKIEGVIDLADPDHGLYETDALLPGPGANRRETAGQC